MPRAALLVGIDGCWHPEWDGLSYAEEDCNRLARALARYNFARRNIHFLTGSHLDRRSMPFKQALLSDGLWDRFAGDEMDMFLFFFAGHGVEFSGQSYLVPWDGVPEDPDSCVPLSEILRRVREVPARQRILILDICHGGRVRGCPQGLPRSFDDELKGVTDAVAFSSCGLNEKSWEDDTLRAGVFTYHFGKALDEAQPSPDDGSISVFDVFRKASEGVQAWARRHHRKQVPRFWGEGGCLYFQHPLRLIDPKPPDFLNDRVTRTHMIVLALREPLTRGDFDPKGSYCVRICATVSSLAISEEEPWGAGEERYRDLLLAERDALYELLEKGAALRIVFTWNLNWLLERGSSSPERTLARLKQLRAFVRKTLRNADHLARAAFVRIPVEERNLIFLDRDFLFEGRKLGVGAGFDATHLIRDRETIEREIEIFDALFEDAVRYSFHQGGGSGPERIPADPRARNRWLLEHVLQQLEKDISALVPAACE